MPKKLIIMVSSTVYGIEELLDRIYSLLTSFGYEVWLSHKGTMPVNSSKSALENCLQAVNDCDLFLGIITPHYGSSKADTSGFSFTQQEMKKAIETRKPRWFLAHSNVIFARQLLRDLGYKDNVSKKALKLKNNASSIEDLRVIDMYEDAIQNDVSLEERQGNWVQKFILDDDAQLFAVAQFSRYIEVEAFIKENFENSSRVTNAIDKGSNS